MPEFEILSERILTAVGVRSQSTASESEGMPECAMVTPTRRIAPGVLTSMTVLYMSLRRPELFCGLLHDLLLRFASPASNGAPTSVVSTMFERL